MPAATALLAASAATQGASSIGGAYSQSVALRAQADFERQQAEMNGRVADLQAEDAIRRGGTDASRALKEGRQVVSAQRAAIAAQGIDVNTGSAGDIQEETRALSEQDAETIKNNAWREAWGFKAQALDMRGKGRFAYMAGQNAASNTLLTGGLNALGGFAKAGGYVAGDAGASSAKSSGNTPMSDQYSMPEFGSSLNKSPRTYRL